MGYGIVCGNHCCCCCCCFCCDVSFRCWIGMLNQAHRIIFISWNNILFRRLFKNIGSLSTCPLYAHHMIIAFKRDNICFRNLKIYFMHLLRSNVCIHVYWRKTQIDNRIKPTFKYLVIDSTGKAEIVPLESLHTIRGCAELINPLIIIHNRCCSTKIINVDWTL